MKSVMTDRFRNTPDIKIPRSLFDRSHGHKTTIDADYLYPMYLDEALPGDTFRLNMSGFARLNTPLYPIMDNMVMETFFFEVPMRLVWENFRRFMGERYPDPDSSIDYTIPTVTLDQFGKVIGSIWDYMGIPVQNSSNSITFSALFSRAYNLIWNEWFRDQNLQDSVVVDTDDGPDSYGNYNLLKANKRHDYFTACLPWPQKGASSALIPLGTSAPVSTTATGAQTAWKARIATTGAYPGSDQSLGIEATSGDIDDAFGTEYYLEIPTGQLTADLTSATAGTINELRNSFQIQKLLEKDARGGTRYIEIIRAHFNVQSPDGRAWRPVYLGGGKSPVNITPIAQTSESGTTPQGNLTAMGTSAFNNHGFTKSFTEHSIIIGLVCVRADLTYSQGLNRMFSRSTRYDFFWPSLSMIGEQAVLDKEIYFNGDANDDDVFGYQERYAEYRYKPSLITGKLRPGVSGSLDVRHLSEEFGTRPSLNSTFIQSNTPVDRVVEVTSEPDFTLDTFFKLHCARPMPLHGIPGMLDHF